MTKRLVLAIVGTAVATLILAGLGTLALASIRARDSTEAELREQSRELVDGLAGVATDQAGLARRRAVLTAIRQALQLDDVAVLQFGAGGRTQDTPPAGVTIADLNVPALLAGETVSGNRGNLVFAAAPAAVGESTLVAVTTRQAGTGLAPAVRWFLLAAVLTVAIAVVVAVTVGRRLTRPVRQVDAAARRIAAGELTTRLPEPAPNARDELADLVRSINTMAAALERSKGLEQQFLLSVSHDLRTPLTSIRGYAEAITDGATKDPEWAARVILVEARRLERLVRDLLDLARLQARSFSLHIDVVDLPAVAASAADGFRPGAHAEGITISTPAPEPIAVRADGDRLAQVVANLVENALRYARRAVVVGVTVADGGAVLTVDDDGPGIAPGDLPHVFERLYVARHQPERQESGSGLGLAIVRELVEAMGGGVRAEAAPGGGARMMVWLPLAGAPLPQPVP